jgi:hypothetical protein
LAYSYQGLHEKGIETNLELSLNNDFYTNKWNTWLTYGNVLIPLVFQRSSLLKPKSRVEAGRLFWTEGFDLSLLDGAQTSLYFSDTLGVYVYGGSSRTLDLLDPLTTPLVGVSVFESVFEYRVRAGWMAKESGFGKQNVYGSIARSFDSLPLQPEIIHKTEWKVSQWGFSQSLTDLVVFPAENLDLGLSHAYREPRAVVDNEQNFLYRLFSQSPQETYSISLGWLSSESLRWQLLSRKHKFNSGVVEEQAEQQDLNLSWQLSSTKSLRPSVTYIRGYGGFVWNSGFNYRQKLSGQTEWVTELFGAYFEKVTSVRGWAHHLRTGMNFYFLPRLSVLSLVEVERNQKYEFDTRWMAYATHFY